MWRSKQGLAYQIIRRGGRCHRPKSEQWLIHAGAAITACASGFVWLQTSYVDNNEKDAETMLTIKHQQRSVEHTNASGFSAPIFPAKSLKSATAAATTTYCEPMVFRVSRLRRHQTIQKMEKMAAKENLESKYKVDWEAPLGEGTFGKVYLAKDRATGEDVAVKKIGKKFTDNASFQREMDALLHIRQAHGHPNICGMRENFDEGGFYYLVLDLVVGGEMFDTLCAQGAYSEADAARLLREVASALAFCHGIGVTHYDLKPENLMLSSQNSSDAVIKLVDFGCAHVTAEDSEECLEDVPEISVSTPAYAPPEVLRMKHAKKKRRNRDTRIDPSFDMWSLGVILYIMLTGVHPFDLYGNSTDDEIEQTILSGKMPPLRNSPLTAHLSDAAVSLIEQLLQWNPKKRLTASQLLENAWVRGETARTSKIADSDKRLSTYRKFKSKLEARVFADMVALADSAENSESDVRTSLIEHAFRRIDSERRGYVTTADLGRLTAGKQNPSEQLPVTDSSGSREECEQLSLSGFSDLLADNMINRYFPKGHVIYKEGDIGNVMFFLESGAIEVYTRDGFKKTLRKSGEFFGEGALLNPKKIRSASIRCLTPVHAIEISREYFEKFLASNEDVQLNLREKDKLRKQQRAETILRLEKSMEERNLRKGEYIFREGEEGKEMFLLEAGDVGISVKGHKVVQVRPGQIFGEHALIFGRPRNVSTQCMSDECKLHVLSSKEFYRTVDSKAHKAMKESIRDLCFRREFQKAICVMTERSFPRNEKELRQAFDTIDKNKSGKLELRNIRYAIQRLDPTFKEHEIREILQSLDLDCSGEVSWAEFKRIFGMAGTDQNGQKI